MIPRAPKAFSGMNGGVHLCWKVDERKRTQHEVGMATGAKVQTDEEEVSVREGALEAQSESIPASVDVPVPTSAHAPAPTHPPTPAPKVA